MDKRFSVYRLDSKVLAVAREGTCRDWTAYVGAVAGQNHDEEWREVADNGTKLPQEVAEFLFPDFAKDFRWRR